MPQNPVSAIANLADLEEGQVALSRFIVQRDEGLYVSLPRLDASEDLVDFVDRAVGSGLYFRALDYARFLALIDDPLALSGSGAAEEVFLAADITAFRPERQALYKDLRVEEGQAAYLFEPLYEDLDDRAASDGGTLEPAQRGLNGAQPHGERRIRLDPDEFIAHAWAQGVRFGIDLEAVREGIALDRVDWRVVARERQSRPGRDAQIIEMAPGLHRNDAPRRLLGDRVDLRQFETRYPQVAAGIRLLRKVPRVLGVDGRDLAGEVLAAPLPQDIDLESLAGPGTKVSREADGEYLLASVCGFLSIDRRSNQFSVADKIVSHEGVSVRTTGDLCLTGEVYEQHGEIQEKRVVQCRTITAYADVYGHVVSTGGLVHLRHNLVGGSASNDDGDIVVDGMASGATLIARHGSINLRKADNCLIIGREVVVGQATNCDIVADVLDADVAEACAVAARGVRMRLSRARRETDCTVLILLPDLSRQSAELVALLGRCEQARKAIAAHRARIDALRREKEVVSYLLLVGKLRNREVILSDEQQAGWRRLTALAAPALRTISQLSGVVGEIESEVDRLGQQVSEIRAARNQACSNVACQIGRVEGETRVSTLLIRAADPPLDSLPARELRARLRRVEGECVRLFAGSRGDFSWAYPAPSD